MVMDMEKTKMSQSKMKRNERKKKKLAALLKITELNNKEREEFEYPGPSGDTLTPEMSSPTKKQKNNTDEEVLSTSQENLDISQDSTGSGDVGSVSRKKKKRKSKHENTCDEGESKRKHKTWSEPEQGEKVEPEEEWPQLGAGDSHRHKRKKPSEADVHKERPNKMAKRYSEVYQRSHNQLDNNGSFADDLANFKKDLERSKLKKDKKEKKMNKSLPETSETAKESDTKETSEGQDDSDEVELPEDDLDELRKLLRERKKQLKEVPMVRLKGSGKEANLDISEPRLPILPCDVQNLLLLSQLGMDCPRFPRWIELKKHNRVCKTVVLVVEGVSAYDLMSKESECSMLQSMDVKAEMVSPYCYNSNFVEELCAVPLTREQKKKLEKRFGKEICPEALLTDKVIKVLRAAFSITPVPKTKSEEVEQKISVPSTDKFPRTELLLSAWQLIEEGFPLPFGNTELGNRYPDYVMTKDQYAEVTPSSPMWALDCEMCLTRAGNELTRVSVVNEQYETVYESFCLPPNPIKNYLTEFSGITAEMLKGVTTRLADIQQDLRELFPPDVILVGQSLNGDLHALKMMHPYVIDTGVIFNLSGERKRKSKLSKLALEFLNWEIQKRGADGHDSVEDSLAALKLVQHKLTKSIEYGDAILSGLKGLNQTLDSKHDDANDANPPVEHQGREFDDLKLEVGPTMATSLFKHFTMKKKTVCVVGLEETLAEYSTFVAAAHKENKQLIHTQTTESNQQTVDQACKQCKEHNFTLAHLVLGEEESINQVDSWMQRLYNSPPFNSLFITVLVGSHSNFANGAALVKVKKPRLKLKTRMSC